MISRFYPTSRPWVSLRFSGRGRRSGAEAVAPRPKGFTLAEVIMSTLVFALLSSGVLISTLYIRREAEASVRESIAFAVSTGFLEQLFSADFAIITNSVDNRTITFPFVTRDNRPLDPARRLQTMDVDDDDWGDPILVPLVDKRVNGVTVPGPQMRMWFIPSVERSADTPNDAVDIRIRYRWERGQSNRIDKQGLIQENTLYIIRTRINT